MKTPTALSVTSSQREQTSLRFQVPRLPRSNVCSTPDLENPSASVHRKRFSTPSLTLKFLCAGELNPPNLKQSSRSRYRLILDSTAKRDGHRLVRDMPRDKVRKILQEIGANRPGMANLTQKILRVLMRYAIDIGWRKDNPVAGIRPYRLGTRHTWSDEQLATFEARWALGTRERLAYALLLYTGQRVGDVVRMRRQDISMGRIDVVQQKT